MSIWNLELMEVGGGERGLMKVELWVLGLCKYMMVMVTFLCWWGFVVDDGDDFVVNVDGGDLSYEIYAAL